MNESKSKKKKSLKGMTLMEIIVSIAVVAIMTVVLVGAASTINSFIKSANRVNKNTALQAPVAESEYTGSATRIDPAVHITVNDDIELRGQLYSVNDPASTPAEDGVGGNQNMKFVTNVIADSSEEEDDE